MTLSTTDSKVIYTGSGITGPFTFTFPIYAASDLVVKRYTIADGTETTFVLNTDYTVAGSFSSTSPAGGTVTLTSTLSSSYKLIIQRVLAYTQSVDLQENDDLPANTIEKSIADRVVMLIQQVKEVIERAVVRDTSQTSQLTFPILTSNGGKALFVNAGATALEFNAVTSTSTDYSGTISAGLDASKPASPSTKDIYVATDTQKIYVCWGASTWSEYVQLSSGSVTSTKLAAQVVNALTTVTGVSTDYIMIADASDSGNVKKALASDFTYVPSSSNALSGSVVQVVNTMVSSLSTGTTTMPSDDTIPQNTEGDEYMTLSITPTNASNKLLIKVVFNYESTSADSHYVALFQDSTANALAAAQDIRGANEEGCVCFNHYMTAGTTSATTFKVRSGNAAAGTTTFNGEGGARRMGGVMASSITIMEIKA